jgi:hypothetical protein
VARAPPWDVGRHLHANQLEIVAEARVERWRRAPLGLGAQRLGLGVSPERHNAGLRSRASSAQRSVSSQAWSARAPSTSSSQSFDQLASSSARP